MKNIFPWMIVLVLATCLAVSTAAGVSAAVDAPRIVVTTTLIETAVRDLLGEDVDVVRLLPPSSCPGHFDMDPGQVTALASARLFVRHDYQAGLDAGVETAGLPASRIVSLPSLPTFSIPANYVALCVDLRDRLAREWPERAAALDEPLRRVKDKAGAVEEDIRRRAEGLRGRRVLCARYQKDFCEWMGLCVVASFNAGADESAWQLNRAVDMGKTAHAEAVVGNLQWGPKHLQSLSEASGLPGVMLSSFPRSGEAGAYWVFIEENVDALRKGLDGNGH